MSLRAAKRVARELEAWYNCSVLITQISSRSSQHQGEPGACNYLRKPSAKLCKKCWRRWNDDVLPHKTLAISIGVATYVTDAGVKIELVVKADQALYEAKTQGGNLVRGAKA